MVRVLSLIALLLIKVDLLYSSFTITGSDGWNGVFEVKDPDAVKKPVILVMIKNGTTNSSIFLESKKQYSVTLDLEDGNYDYFAYDGDKKLIENGKFNLRTPFVAAFKRVASDRIVMEIRPAGAIALVYILELSNRTVSRGITNISGITELKMDGLGHSSAYRLILSSGTYSKKADFITGPKNIALNKPVFGTFNRYPVSRFIDDSTPAMTRINDGRWEWLKGMAASGEVNSEEQFVYINLEKPSRLRSVTVVWHADYYPLTYYFVYGTDGKNWNVIKRDAGSFISRMVKDNTPVKIDEIRTNVEAGTIGIVIKKGEKIRSRLASRNYVELLEIEANE